ncbi:MAG: hypothetical protein EBZ74_04305 [Planctomycetia bacterium]|nr:hypothetical protein [Planctomycetia bacterium]
MPVAVVAPGTEPVVNELLEPITVSSQETRLWQKLGGRWQHVHFHRS